MTLTYSVKTRIWIAMSGLAILLFTQVCFPQGGARKRPEPPSTAAGGSSQFIVAFELSPDRDFNFTWPLESMRPAPYEIVLMVVEKMPGAWDGKGKDRRAKPLAASRHLKINGRLQKPVRILRTVDGAKRVDPREQFLVRLEQGRVRLALSVPPGLSLDPQHNTARIKLYQINKDNRRRPAPPKGGREGPRGEARRNDYRLWSVTFACPL